MQRELPVVCNYNIPDSCEIRVGSKVTPENMGWITRGNTTRAKPGYLDLMWILINPGTPQGTMEHNFYSGKEGGELADTAWAFKEKVLEGKAGQSLALSDAIKDAATVLQCNDPLDVLDRCLVTNVARCSTPQPWSKSLKGKSDSKKQIVDTCFNKHMRAEVEYWSPKAIIAGSAVSRDALSRLRLEWTCKNCSVKSCLFLGHTG